MSAFRLSSPRLKALTATVIAAAASVIFTGTATSAEATGCLPEARPPAVSGGYGTARGYLPCGGSFTIRLVNYLGTTLGSPWSNTCSGACTITWGSIACAGTVVHTSLYVNLNGTGMSDESSIVNC